MKKYWIVPHALCFSIGMTVEPLNPAKAGQREHYQELLKKDLGQSVVLTSKGWSSAPADKGDIPEKLASDVANEIHYFIQRKPDSKSIISKNLKSITVVYSKSGSKNPELKWVGTDLQVIADPISIDRRWSGSIQTQIKSIIPENFAGSDKVKENNIRVERAVTFLNKDLTDFFHEKQTLTASVDWESMKVITSEKEIDTFMAKFVHLLSGVTGLKEFIGFKTGRNAVLSKITKIEMKYDAKEKSVLRIQDKKLVYSIRETDLGRRIVDGPTREDLLKVFGVKELKND